MAGIYAPGPASHPPSADGADRYHRTVTAAARVLINARRPAGDLVAIAVDGDGIVTAVLGGPFFLWLLRKRT